MIDRLVVAAERQENVLRVDVVWVFLAAGDPAAKRERRTGADDGIVEALEHLALSGRIFVHCAQTPALDGKTMGDNMCVSDNAVFVVRTAIDDAHQNRLSQQVGDFARRHLESAGEKSSSAQTAPLCDSGSHRRSLYLVGRNNAARPLR
jgi:hypothetical protein